MWPYSMSQKFHFYRELALYKNVIELNKRIMKQFQCVMYKTYDTAYGVVSKGFNLINEA